MNEYEQRYIKRRNFVLKILGVLAALGVIVLVLFKAPSVERHSGSYDGVRIAEDGSISAARVEFDLKYKEYLFDRRDYLNGDLNVSAADGPLYDEPSIFPAENSPVDIFYRQAPGWDNADLGGATFSGYHKESNFPAHIWMFFNRDFTFAAVWKSPHESAEGMLYVSHADTMTDGEASLLFDELVRIWGKELGGLANPYR